MSACSHKRRRSDSALIARYFKMGRANREWIMRQLGVVVRREVDHTDRDFAKMELKAVFDQKLDIQLEHLLDGLTVSR